MCVYVWVLTTEPQGYTEPFKILVFKKYNCFYGHLGFNDSVTMIFHVFVKRGMLFCKIKTISVDLCVLLYGQIVANFYTNCNQRDKFPKNWQARYHRLNFKKPICPDGHRLTIFDSIIQETFAVTDSNGRFTSFVRKKRHSPACFLFSICKIFKNIFYNAFLWLWTFFLQAI